MNIITEFSQYQSMTRPKQPDIAKVQTEYAKSQNQQQNEYKGDFFDKICEKVVNKRDITDMVTTPRAIFKGYLCFTAGTAINSIAAWIKKPEISKYLNIAGSIISIYGTYNFVKYFSIKGKDLTKSEK